MSTAVITGASRGLGREIASALAARGWHLVVDARTQTVLDTTAEELRANGASSVHAIAGDIADPVHRGALVDAVSRRGELQLLVHNASLLGPSPMPLLADYAVDALTAVYAVNVVAPIALTQLLLPTLAASAGRIIAISSDAGVEPYDHWGGYGSSKAALDHATAILGVENPDQKVYALDPGDMRTQMHQDAFPGEDISDRPLPATVVPTVLELLDGDLPSGRYRAADLASDDPAEEVA